MEQMAALGGMILVIFAVAMVVGLLVAGLILKFSVRLLQGFSPGFGKSVLVVFLAGVVGFIINIVLASVVGSGMPDPSVMGTDEAAMAGAMMGSLGVMAIGLVASLFINAFFINLMIKAPDGQAIGYGRSCLVALLYLVAMVVIGIIAGIGLGILMAAMGMGAAAMGG
ncbi:MAG TPA: hypothetical protein VFQ84_02925 [Arenimonas sp.]|uniref:hypothetical protein n=1 Tax=Arenimonas sp. TaxID=1872635 RepID=UPI002D7F3C08|nr:hypothetical protein [Arenimonas sp.]HEU0152281.1 hypothetical protein [Arenimonas sp.]